MNPDDPKFTAHVLGEVDDLTPAERAEIEALLANDPAAAAEAEEMRTLGARLRADLHAEEGQPLRYASYRAWAAQHEDRPSPDTIVRCLGPWVIALARAGLQVDRRRGVYRLAQTEPSTDDAAPDTED